MRHCVVLDSCFLVGVLDSTDSFHQDSTYLFTILLSTRTRVKIILPAVVLYETIVILTRRGISHRRILGAVTRLIHNSKIIILSLTETSALKHCRRLLSQTSQIDALRTADYMIACIGVDFEAQILTFDKIMRNRVKKVYPSIYYCSSKGGMIDETGNFLAELELQAV